MHKKVRGGRDALKEIGYFIQGVVSKHIPAVNAKTKPLLQLIDESWTRNPPLCSGQRAHEQVRQIRWSPGGAQRVLQARAVVIDGRLGSGAINLVA